MNRRAWILLAAVAIVIVAVFLFPAALRSKSPRASHQKSRIAKPAGLWHHYRHIQLMEA